LVRLSLGVPCLFTCEFAVSAGAQRQEIFMVINHTTRPTKGKEQLIRKASSNVVGMAGLGEDWSTRRRIMQALRKSTSVLGIGQKCRIGRLGGGAAIGAIVMGFATPALAQYAAGGGTANDPQSTAVGSGAVAGQAGVQTVDTNGDGTPDLTLNQDTAVGANASATGGYATAIGNGVSAQGIYATAIGSSNTATGNGAIALGRLNTVDSFGAGTTMVAQGVLNRVTGAGNQTLGNGATDVTAVGIGIGTNNIVDGAGVAVGSGNLVNNAGSSGFAFGNANAATGAYSAAIGMGNNASATAAIAIGTINVASGNTAIAMGRQSTASGATSIAMGNVSTANQTNAIAIGHSTQATGIGAIAMGGGNNGASTNFDATAARAAAANAIALGTNSTADQANAIAIGLASASSGVDGLSIGHNARSWDGSIAIGSGASADHLSTNVADGSVAIGPNANVGNATERGLAMGAGAQVTGFSNDSIAIGSGAQSTDSSATALGASASASAVFATAIGANTSAAGGSSTAIGRQATVTATGTDSLAVGYQTTVSGINSLALGNQVTVSGNQSVGIMGPGGVSTVSGGDSVVINPENAPRTYSASGVTAVGSGAFASGSNATAIGRNATANGVTAIAAGSNSVASGPSSVAIGNAANANRSYSIAIGESAVAGSTVGADNTIAIGRNASSTGLNGTAIGLNSRQTNGGIAAGNDTAATGLVATSIGYRNSAAGNFSTAVGTSNTASGVSAIAIGNGSTASSTNSIAIGTGNNVSGNNSGAIGDPNIVTGSGSYALGNNNTINANNAFVIGNNITIAAGQDGSVGIGNATTVAAPNSGAFTLNGGTAAATAPTAVVSVGASGAERQITNVAAGVVSATSTDAVNGSQLYTVATAANNLGDSLETVTGGGLVINPDGTIATAPTINAAGLTFANATAAIEALNTGNNTANTGLASAIGGGMAIAADGTVTAPNFNVNGATYGSVSDALSAAGAGFNLTTAATGTGVANGTTVEGIGAGETQTLTAGNNIITTQVGNEVQVALNPALTGITSLAITGGPTISATGITGLAAGALSASSTDAVNGSQLFATNEAITNLSNGTSGLVQQAGGTPGAGQISVGVATGGTSVSFAGTDGDRVLTGVAAGALNATSADAVTGAQVFANNQSLAGLLGGGAGVDPVTGALTAPSYSVGGNTYGNVGAALSALQSGAPVQYSTAGAPTTPNGLVPSQNMTLVGAAAGPVTLSNVGPAGLSATSTDAVNGSQINTLAASNAAIIGGGSTFDPVTGALTAPTIAVGGSNYANITDAIEAGDDKADAGLQSVADALGGGAVYDPTTGSITAPSYAVQGSSFTNAGAAFGAVDTALNNLANGTSGLVQQVGGAPGSGNLTVGAATGGTVVDFTGTEGVRSLTGLANGALVAGSTDAVTGAQVNTGLTSIADALGGGASFDPVTGTVTAPTYSVAGGSQSDAGAAFAALNTASNAANAGISSVIGGGMAIGPDGTLTSPSFNVNGSSYGTVADALAAAGGGFNLTTAATGSGIANSSSVEQIGAGETVTLTAGNNIVTTQIGGETQVALNAALTGINSISITGGPTLSNTGIAMNGGGISGLAAGSIAAGSTDAINGGQLFTTNTNVANLGARVGTVEGDVTAIQSDVASLANGTSGLVQQAVGAAPITVGAATGGTMLNVAGTAGNRTVTGVAAGAVTASSTDAVNGAQLFAVQTTAEGALQRSGGTMTGNIDMGGNRITNVAAPMAGTDAVNRDYVDGLAAAGSATTNALGTTAAANLGGGASFDPATGTISAPSYVVGGVARTNVGDAIAATNRLGVQYVADAAGNPTNVVRLTGDGSGQAVAVTNVAAGALTATSSDAVNGSQLYAVQQVAAGAVQYDRNADGSLNTSSVSFGPPNTPTVLRNVAAATRSTDAVNLGQFNAGLAATLGSANAYTDTKINQISFDLGKVAKRAYAGTASAIALQPPAILDAGSVAMRGGVGYYRGAWAMGLSLRATSENGRWSLSGGVAGGPNSGVAASAGVDFVLGD
jgi:trimeric autotransporter adhesin